MQFMPECYNHVHAVATGLLMSPHTLLPLISRLSYNPEH